MQDLLTFITEISASGSNAGTIIKMFGERLESLYGPCAIALISQSGLSADQCQVTVLVDDTNTTVISDDHLAYKSENQPVYTHQNLHTVLNPSKPCVIQGNDRLIRETFGKIFHPYSTIISIPLFLPQGVSKWMFLLFDNPTVLEPLDIERILLIATLAANLGTAVENTQQLQRANQWIEDELNSVAKIQRQLLPHGNPATPELKIASRFVPYSRVGGDYYDIAQLTPFLPHNGAITGHNQWGFMIADASGHGSAAAVEIAMFDAILRTYPPNIEAGPAGVFNYANRHLFTRTIRGSFITAFVSAYFPDQGILSYCNAGHPPPMLKKQVQPRDILFLDESTGIPLGVTPDGQWQSVTIDMERGDTLILYTDGLTEAVSPTGEPFGQQRLQAVIADSDNDPELIVNNIEKALAAYQQGALQNDDRTLLVVQAAAT